MHTLLAAAACLTLAPLAAASDDAAIAVLLERIEQAVLAADADTYLACVDRAEAEWAIEQANWAADLAEHAPEEFEIALTGDLDAPDGEPGWLVANLEMSWRLPGADRRSVSFPASFVARGESWLYAGETWRRVASPDGQNVALYLDDDLREVAERVVEVMPEIRAHVDEGFKTHLEHPQVVKLYGDMRHLQQSIYLSYEEPLGGWNEPGEAIKILGSEGTSARRLRILLSHEYGHVATFTYGPDASDNIPWWVAEGVAELAAERYSGPSATEGAAEMVRAWARAGSLAPWEKMADFRQTPPDLHPNVYIQGHHFMGYVSERFGRTARNRWVRLLVAGTSVDDASREAFGLDFESLDRDWRASVEPGPPTTDENG